MPAVIDVGGVPVIVGGRFGGALTTIENVASCALPPCPSLTAMPMFENVPTLPAAGVPCSRPVVVLNVAQLGWFAMLNVKVPPSESLAVGVNEYCVPAVAVVGGDPAVVGGTFANAVTTLENVASWARPPCASLTPMPMLENVPTFAAVGAPANRPVAVLNVAQAGRFVMLKVSVPPSGSLAVGVNAYAVPAVTNAGGTPAIVGGWFGAALTAIENVA